MNRKVSAKKMDKFKADHAETTQDNNQANNNKWYWYSIDMNNVMKDIKPCCILQKLQWDIDH